MPVVEFASFGRPQATTTDDVALEVASMIPHMSPGDKIIIERHKYEPAKSLFTLTIKDSNA